MTSVSAHAETPQHRSRYLTRNCGPEFSLPHLSLFSSRGTDDPL